MNQYIKISLSIIVLIFIIVISSVAYNSLKGKYAKNDSLISKDNEKNTDSKGKNEDKKVKAVDFTVVDKDNVEITLKSVIGKGKPIVINFWASWCPPCKSEMPNFQKVYEELGEKVQFLMVNVTDGSRETKTTAFDYIESKGYTFPVYYDSNQSATYAYYISAMPTTFFINKNGDIITSVQGAIDEKILRKGILKAIEN